METVQINTLSAKLKTQEKFRVKDLLTSPEYAYPTIFLFLSAYGLWFFGLVAGFLGNISLPIAMSFVTLGGYILFTPMHDAAHKSVSQHKFLNEFIGRLCALTLMAPFPAFRFSHLEHHKHTNVEKDDPDFWSGYGKGPFKLFYWMTQDLFYYYFYIKSWNKRATKEKAEVVFTIILALSALGYLTYLGFGMKILLLWAIPSRISISLLAFAFDYLPHRPHKISSHENRYIATSNFSQKWLSFVIIYQNFHLTHHLFPAVPFYRYKTVWNLKKEDLLQKGATVRDVFTNKIVEGPQS